MNFQEIAETRFAAKHFNGRTVPPETIRRLKEIIRLAPTSFNVQPWKAKVVEDAGTKAALGPATWDQPQIETCSHLFVFCADTDVFAITEKLKNEAVESGGHRKLTEMMVAAANQFLRTYDADRLLCWAKCQAYLALANGIHGARELGLDACPMDMFAEDEYSRILGLPSNLKPTVLLAVGYAADKPGPRYRFASEYLFL